MSELRQLNNDEMKHFLTQAQQSLAEKDRLLREAVWTIKAFPHKVSADTFDARKWLGQMEQWIDQANKTLSAIQAHLEDG